MKKRIISLLLVLVLLIAMTPVSVFAAKAPRVSLTGQVPDHAAPAQIQIQASRSDAAVNSTTYSITLEAGSNGVTELGASSAEARQSVYILANPDPGYLAYFGGSYDYTNYDLELYYVGYDIWELVMPDGDVNLTVTYEPAEGSNHSITVEDELGCTVVLSQDQAKEYESVYLGITLDPGYTLEDVRGTYNGTELEDIYYLGEVDGVHIVELFMPNADVELTVTLSRNGPFTLGLVVGNEEVNGQTYYECDKGVITLSHGSAYEGETVTVTVVAKPGHEVTRVTCMTAETTYIGDGQWTFVMPPHSEEIHVHFKPPVRNVSLVLDSEKGGTAELSTTTASQGDTVTVTCTPDEGYHVARVTAGNSMVTDLGNGQYSFVMQDQDTEVHVLFLRDGNPFADVPEDAYFYDPVMWAVEKGITAGTGEFTFSPYEDVERCQMVTLLWRAAGCPVPENNENPFSDVNETHYFYTAVLWAVEKGITQGTSATTFGPFEKCERCQVVTFLWRAAGSPDPTSTNNPFTDVKATDYYYNAVLWAVEEGITSGTTATTFSPNDITERCQAVTFLYRCYN